MMNAASVGVREGSSVGVSPRNSRVAQKGMQGRSGLVEAGAGSSSRQSVARSGGAAEEYSGTEVLVDGSLDQG